MTRTSFPGLASLRLSLALGAAALFTVAAHATIGLGLQRQLGNPSNAAADSGNHTHILIDRAQYSLDYNDTTHEPNWVSWDLTTADVGSSGRSNFIVDDTLPAGFYRVLTTDYSGSGYDRGHLCPSADRTITAADNQIVFYMSNMMPQAPDNNQGVWGNFEGYCRSLAAAGNEVLITCGPSGFGGSSIASGVAIPGYTWKIAVVVPDGPGSALSRITTSTRVITIKVPNIAGVRSTPWQNFTVSVAQIEADTGYTFFDALPAATAAALKTVVDGQVVVGAPAITAQPMAQTTAVGGSASFSVSATGNAPLTYQWFKDDAEVDGATNATLDLAGVTGADAGNYVVVVTNAVGAATSNAAALIITGVPPSIITPPAPQTVAAGSNVVFSVAAAGSPTLSYAWHRNGAPVAGGTSAVLNVADAQQSATYDVTVTNSDGFVTSAGALLAVTSAAPTITTQPATQTTTGGTTVVLSVAAAGSEPMTFQWRKGGIAVTSGTVSAGANTSTLTLSNVTTTDSGSYDAVVINGIGSATSNAAVVTVNAATVAWTFGASTATADPTSGLPADITGGTVTQGNSQSAVTMISTTSVPGGSNGNYTGSSGTNNAQIVARAGPLNKTAGTGSAYFEFTLAPTADKKLVATGISFGSRSTGTGPAAYSVFTSFDGFTTAVANGTLTTDGKWGLTTPAFSPVTGTTGAALTFRIYGHSGAGSVSAANWRIDDLKLNVSTLVPSAAFAPAVTATSPAGGVTGVAVSAPITITFNQPVVPSNGWFAINSAASGALAATVTGGPISFTLTPPADFTYGDTISVTILAGKVTEKDTNTLTLPANYNFSFNTGLPVAPAITNQPQSRSVPDFGSTTFSVGASGTAPLTYQWRKNGTPISGNASASNATLNLSNVSPADAGSYDCVVSNLAGSATSNPAMLAVTLVAPTIVTQPSARTVSAGGGASFTVSAAGSAPLTYQWRKNGANLADGPGVVGSHTPTLALSGVTVASVGSFDVSVANPVSSVTSAAVPLNVTAATLSVVTWNFDGAINPADPSSPLPVDITGGTVTQGNNNGTTTLITASSVSPTGSGFSGSNNAGLAARIGALNQAAGGSAYFEFSLVPAIGKQMVATALSFGSRSTGTGPQAFAVFTSADNFAAPIATGPLVNNSAWALINPISGGARGAPGVPLTFRIYGYNGAGSPGAGTANWRIDDLQLTVGTELPPAVATTSPAASATGVALASPITITFNQAVNASGSWFSVNSALHGTVSVTISGGPTTYTLTPASSWSYSDTLTVNVVAAQIRDLTDTLAMPANYSFSFGTLVPTPPSITTPPVAQTATVNDTVTFMVEATGTAPLVYQWRKNSQPIDGATSASLTLPNLVTTDAGSYDVAVTNIAGTKTSAAATLVVNKATPTITWPAIAAITYGTALSSTQLNATASTGGSFVYTPAAGAIVNAGVNQLSVTFTPADANNYNNVTAANAITVNPAAVMIMLSNLAQAYDGAPKSVTVATAPMASLAVTVTYDGSATAPTNPGSYVVNATVDDANYFGSATATLTISTTALVRHAPVLNGGIDGSIQVLSAEDIALGGGAWVSGDLLVPGTPSVRLNGNPMFAGVIDAGGNATPSSFSVTLNGGAVLRHLVQRADAIPMPVVATPPPPTSPNNLTANGNGGSIVVVPGVYGNITAGGSRSLMLGVPGATEPAIYSVQNLALNGNAALQVVGPVILTLANGTTFNTNVGAADHSEWLTLEVASGGVTLNGSASVHGAILAPNGSVIINGNSAVHGSISADKLTITANGLVDSR